VAAVTSALSTVNALNTGLGGLSGTKISITGTQTIDESSGTPQTYNGHNYRVFTVTSFSAVNSNTVTINGDGSGDVVVLNFTSSANLHSSVALTGGLTPDQVLWNFFGGSNLSGGPTVDVNTNKGPFYGVVLNPNGPMSAEDVRFQGRFFGGDSHDLQWVSGAFITPPPVPVGSCQGASSLAVLVTGKNVVAYVPKGSWGGGATGVSTANVEPTPGPGTAISTTSVVNSCAANSVTGQVVCTANDTNVYVITGTTVSNTLTSGGGPGEIGFSGGVCTNCSVAMDAVHNKAVIGLSIGGTVTAGVPNLDGAPGFQVLDLGTTPTFEPAFKSPAGVINEDPLIDPTRNFLLSPNEADFRVGLTNNFEIIDLSTSTAPKIYENSLSSASHPSHQIQTWIQRLRNAAPGSLWRRRNSPVSSVHCRFEPNQAHARYARYMDRSLPVPESLGIGPVGGCERERRRAGNTYRRHNRRIRRQCGDGD
jgi:hypothetical protein